MEASFFNDGVTDLFPVKYGEEKIFWVEKYEISFP